MSATPPRPDGDAGRRPEGLAGPELEILAEVNFAPRLGLPDLLLAARRFQAEGADRIDVGCEPGVSWSGVGEAVAALRDQGHRVSIDSFDPTEVRRAVAAGADLVLSVNAANRERAPDWGVEVVVIPDRPGTLDGLAESVDYLSARGVPMRIDPILEPIGFGLSASLGRYIEARRRWPEAAMMMGVGNLTELTDADSAGLNVLLAGFCLEVGIGSVLTTAVVNWAVSSVRELDLARRMAFHRDRLGGAPPRAGSGLIVLRDALSARRGRDAPDDLARRLEGPLWRIFAEDGEVHAMNGSSHLSDSDPFLVFERMEVEDPRHAFRLGYEMMKAKTALTLGKAYRQGEPLDWGFLTEPESGGPCGDGLRSKGREGRHDAG